MVQVQEEEQRGDRDSVAFFVYIPKPTRVACIGQLLSLPNSPKSNTGRPVYRCAPYSYTSYVPLTVVPMPERLLRHNNKLMRELFLLIRELFLLVDE